FLIHLIRRCSPPPLCLYMSADWQKVTIIFGKVKWVKSVERLALLTLRLCWGRILILIPGSEFVEEIGLSRADCAVAAGLFALGCRADFLGGAGTGAGGGREV